MIFFDKYFESNNKSQVDELLAKYRDDSDLVKSFEHYYSIHMNRIDMNQVGLDPYSFLSRDLSAIFYDGCPVVFGGSNLWSTKKFLDLGKLDEKFDRACAQVNDLISKMSSSVICFVAVPEKDMLISKIRSEYKFYDNINFFLNRLSDYCKSKGALFDYTTSIDYADQLKVFEYPDSHPPHKFYEVMFANIMHKFGHSLILNENRYLSKYYGDLAKKFSIPLPQSYEIDVLEFEGSTPSLVDGVETYLDPLSSIEQFYVNNNAVYDKSVLVLGDSHSSLYSEKRLVYLLANTFKQVDFKWKPFGYGMTDFHKKYDYVIVESSLRFLVS